MGKLNSLLIHRELTAQVTAKASFLLTARLTYPHGDLEEVNVLESGSSVQRMARSTRHVLQLAKTISKVCRRP